MLTVGAVETVSGDEFEVVESINYTGGTSDHLFDIEV